MENHTLPVYFSAKGLCKMSCRGAARLGMEPVGATHRMALRLPMQREESRRIAKLYEFTGKVGLGSIVGRYLLRVGGRKLQVSPLRQTMKLFGFGRDDRFWVGWTGLRLAGDAAEFEGGGGGDGLEGVLRRDLGKEGSGDQQEAGLGDRLG